MENKIMEKRLVIVDISSFIFRAFYAIRPMNAPDGTPTNAINGVLSMLLKLIEKYEPSHLVLAQDSKEKTFRHEMYDEYKANRSEPPEDLIPQFKLINSMTEKMGLQCKQIIGYEADDIIGSLCIQWKSSFEEVLIASSDKDLMQFVGDNVFMLDTMKDVKYDTNRVKDKMGVWPNQIVDFLSIVGDSSDNVPGMKGIGVKGASQLLAQYGTLNGCIENKHELKGKRVIDAFNNHIEDAELSKRLVSIKCDLELGFDVEQSKLLFYPTEDLIQFLKDLGFKRDVVRLEKLALRLDAPSEQSEKSEAVEEFDYAIVDSDDEINEIRSLLEKNEQVSLYTKFKESDSIEKDIEGVAVSFDGSKSFYFDIGSNFLGIFLKLIEEKSSIEIISEHSKRDHFFLKKNIEGFKGIFFDTVQAHYVVDSSGNHSFEKMVENSLGLEVPKLDKKDGPFSDLPLVEKSKYLGIRACSNFLLASKLKKDLDDLGLKSVYFDIDLKLLPILASMEQEGILINHNFFKELEEEFQEKLKGIEDQVKEALKELDEKIEVNLRSPKQVGFLLFEKLGLPVVSKTKTGYSTSAEVLEELDSKGLSNIPKMIIHFREIDKLLSTYVRAIPELADSKSRRVHTHFNQHTAATGRLSSVHPNLQNIPIRSGNGKKIRKGFIASPGRLLLTADYSQVELRILAHFSEDPTMVKSFLDGLDIHSQTASEVLAVPLDQVSANDRSMAKAVNFGLMYGQSSFGLAKALGISRREAKNYITMYFERFNKVKGYMDSLKEVCEERGYTQTLFGRKRFLPDINSKNRTIKSAAERIAVNSPIQGTAADIIKVAMINISDLLKKENLKSKMLLQVHDELIFEVLEEEIEAVKEIVKSGMEGVVKLKVPLNVDMSLGVNWYDLK